MITRLIQEIQGLAGRQLRPGSILVMHRSYQALETIHERLTKLLGPGTSQLLQDVARLDSNALVGLTSFNAGTGLEAPIVFVLGCDELLENENALHLSTEEQATLRRDHTRQLYMAMTRAARQLVLLCHRPETAQTLSSGLS